MQGEDADPIESRAGRTWLVVCVSILLLLPVIGAAVIALQSDTFWLGSRRTGWRLPLTREQALAMLLPVLALFAALILRNLWKALRHIRSASAPAEIQPLLSLGEPPVWTGRPGWRSFRGPRVVFATLAAFVPGLFVWWIWSTWSQPGYFAEQVFFTIFALFLFLIAVAPSLVIGSPCLRAWLCDLFGTLAVTRRRIVWLSPWRRTIYREIAGEEIVDVILSSNQGRHGSLTVIRRKDGDDVEHVFLEGIPTPEAAYWAIQALIPAAESTA